MYFWQMLANISFLNACHVLFFQSNWIFRSKYGHIYINPVLSIAISLALGENSLGSRTWLCCIQNRVVSNCDITGGAVYFMNFTSQPWCLAICLYSKWSVAFSHGMTKRNHRPPWCLTAASGSHTYDLYKSLCPHSSCFIFPNMTFM